MMSDFLGRCENLCFISQTGEATFWAPFATTWATFYFNIWSHCPTSIESQSIGFAEDRFSEFTLLKIQKAK